MRKQNLVLMTAMFCVLALAAVAMAADPLVGTWQLNLAKSKFNPGPAPKSLIVTFTAQDNGLKHVGDQIGADGNPGHSEFAAKVDGKDYPLTGFTDADTIAIKRIDVSTSSELFKKAGKNVFSARLVVSKDGKMLTRTTKEKNAKGQEVINTYVFNKQ